jgi:hypothetical protein
VNGLAFYGNKWSNVNGVWRPGILHRLDRNTTGIMLVATAFFSYLTFHQITSGATGRELTPLIHAFPTALGLISIVGQARAFIIAVALCAVAVADRIGRMLLRQSGFA